MAASIAATMVAMLFWSPVLATTTMFFNESPPTLRLQLLPESNSRSNDNPTGRQFSEASILAAHNEAESQLKSRLSALDNLLRRLRVSNGQSLSQCTNDYFSLPDFQASKQADLAQAQVMASQLLAKSLNNPGQSKQVADQLATVDVSSFIPSHECPKLAKMACTPLRYRTLDGICNNVGNPWFGSSGEPFQRYSEPRYEDGLGSVRSRSVSRIQLPGVRSVTVNVHRVTDESETEAQVEVNLLVPTFAQFVLNDLVAFAEIRVLGADGSCVPCCNLKPGTFECLSIGIPPGDAGFPKNTCLPYSRLLPAPRSNCGFGPRVPMNLATSFLDGSQIYGSTVLEALQTRTMQNGQMQIDSTDRFRWLINSRGSFEGVNDFTAASSTLSFLWLSEHNRIANALAQINSQWSDEQLYEEARRIVVAEMQHIVYNEFLPIVVGSEQSWKWSLSSNSLEFYGGYNMSANPEITVEFAIAAAQFFNSMWPSQNSTSATITASEKANSDAGPLKAIIHPTSEPQPQLLHQPQLPNYRRRTTLSRQPRLSNNLPFGKPLLRSPQQQLLKSHPNTVSNLVSTQITDQFRKHPSTTDDTPRYDLISLLLQMARDSGLGTYMDVRRVCGLPVASSFDELSDFMLSDAIEKLNATYAHVGDIDLLVGGLSEQHAKGALVGPTFQCLFTAEFQRLKISDRYWYESYMYPTAFAPERLSEIRKVSLARILCDNLALETVSPSAFLASDDLDNFPVACNETSIPHVNLKMWHDVEARPSLPISFETLQKAIALGKQMAKSKLDQEDSQIVQNPVGIADRSQASFRHARIMQTTPIALMISQAKSEILLETTKAFIQRMGLDAADLPDDLDTDVWQALLPTIDVTKILATPDSQCLPRDLPCDFTSKYRKHDGWCNNLNFPGYGTSYSTYRRWLLPAYQDGFDEPRSLSMTGKQLPSPRAVSNAVHQTKIVFQEKFNLILMQFGQFINHDMQLTPIATGPGGETLDCSDCNSAQTVSVNCLPIPIPANDSFFPTKTSKGAPRCMSYTRSLVGNLRLGYRQQINQITSFIDAGNVYGSEDCTANALREHGGGLLRIQKIAGHGEYLPPNPSQADCSADHKHACFHAGDVRVNTQIGLEGMHTIWVREHNRLAKQLSIINPHWTDEVIYQESRKIVGALIQHITYREWLKKVIGNSYMSHYDLLPLKQGYFSGYNQFCDPSMANEFSAAVFRFGHSVVWAEFFLFNGTWNRRGKMFSMKDNWNSADPVYESQGALLHNVLQSMVAQPCLSNDRLVDPILRNNLFSVKGDNTSGLDLAAINIQRGRDHGIASYTKYREFAQLTVPKNFEDLLNLELMSNETISALRSVYESVDDIDLFTGVITETPLKGAMVGHLGAFLIGEQFSRLRRCDRFWHENGEFPGAFSLAQLAEIRKYSMAKVLCRHTPLLQTVPPHVFDQPNELQNAPVSCEQIPDMDLSVWLNRDFCQIIGQRLKRGETRKVSPCISCTCTTDGPICQSFFVNNCLRLMATVPAVEIISDRACVVQCKAFFAFTVPD